MKPIYLILISIGLAVSGQLCMKIGMTNYQMGDITLQNCVVQFTKMVFRPFVFIGFMLFLVSSLFWLMALAKVPLSFAYPFTSISYVLILFFSSILFKEQMIPIRWLGAAVIILGLYLVSRSGSN
jgi:drug/metabolite transporter (DMT)-like permease